MMPRLSLRRWIVYTAASLCCFTALCLWNDDRYLNRRSCTCAERNHGQAFLDPQSSLRNTTRGANMKVKTDRKEERTTSKTAPLNANISSNTQTASLLNETETVSVEHARYRNCTRCFQSDFPLLADQPELCQVTGSKAIDMLFMVVSAPAHRAQRDAIRKSWASVTLNNTSSTQRHVFMLGTTTEAKLARQVEDEARDHRDVVVHGFRDTYLNLTLKVIASLRWVVTRCQPARYFMKVDDDVWINTARVTSLMRNNSDFLQHGIMGACSDSYRPHRSNKSKWYVTKDLYPANRYPPYCRGPAYFSSMGVAKAVVAVFPTTPFFPFEDVYVGMCLQRLGLGVKNHDSFGHRRAKYVCQGRSVDVSAIHNVAPSRMLQLWNAKC